MGTFVINMSQCFEKFNITADNVDLYENIVRNNGKFFTLDPKPYFEWLNLFNIFYTYTA